MKDTIREFCLKTGVPEEIMTLMPEEIPAVYSGIYDDLIRWEACPRAVAAMNSLIDANPDNGLLCLLIYIEAALALKAEYEKRRIPDTIYYDTMRCFARFCAEYKMVNGVWGYANVAWPIRQVNFRLFRLGRLEFELLAFPHEDTNVEGLRLTKGCPVLSVHIPCGSPLDHNACSASYQQARAFFKQYFPDFQPQAFYCASWLLFPGLSDILPADSNILTFQKDYTLVDSSFGDFGMMWRIFGRERENLEDYPVQTTLQRNLVRHLKNGGQVGAGMGVIPL